MWINDYKTLEAQLVNCKINNVIQFFDQVNANLFKKKQKVESSALGLLKTLLSEVINKKQSKPPVSKAVKSNMRQDARQHKNPLSNYAYPVQQSRTQEKPKSSRRRRHHAKRAEKLKKQSNTDHQAMISKSIDELQSQIRLYQVAVGLIVSAMFFGTGGLL